jgi:pimeloyl-ACP methyl ester carboxylesterase
MEAQMPDCADLPKLPEPGLVQTPLGRVSFREAGNGPVLLLLHGMNGSSKSWAWQLDAFSGRYRVVAWDAPGYGLSDVVEPEVDIYAEQAARLAQALDCSQLFVVGHSMGGVVAGRLCCRYPNLVRALVLSGTHWGNAVEPGTPLASKYARRLRDLEQLPAAEYGEARARRMLPDGTSERVLQQVAAIAAETRPDGLRAAGQMVDRADNRELLRRLRHDVLILAGERDSVGAPERSAKLSEHIDGARLVTLPGVGHAPYLEAPRLFNEAVERFLAN